MDKLGWGTTVFRLRARNAIRTTPRWQADHGKTGAGTLELAYSPSENQGGILFSWKWLDGEGTASRESRECGMTDEQRSERAVSAKTLRAVPRTRDWLGHHGPLRVRSTLAASLPRKIPRRRTPSWFSDGLLECLPNFGDPSGSRAPAPRDSSHCDANTVRRAPDAPPVVPQRAELPRLGGTLGFPVPGSARHVMAAGGAGGSGGSPGVPSGPAAAADCRRRRSAPRTMRR